MLPQELAAIGWPARRLPGVVAALCERAGLKLRKEIPHATAANGAADAADVIEWHAEAFGCEAEAIHTNLRDVDEDLAHAYPAVLQMGEDLFLAITRITKRTARVLTPELKLHNVPWAELLRLLRERHVQQLEEPFQKLLANSKIKPSRRAQAIAKLVREQLSSSRFDACWVLRPYPGEATASWLSQANAYRLSAGLVITHTVQYLFWLAAWGILGTLSFQGRMDRGWLLAWALLLLTLVPFRVLTTWLQGALAIGVGAALKRRLLLGALRLQPDEMRNQGIGAFLGQVLEAEAVETLALSGGIGGLLAIIEIAVSGFVLGQLALLLLAWCVITLFAAWRFVVRYQSWTDTRMEMTQDLVEQMVGHRTRLAQQARAHWHDSEDETLANYVRVSGQVDRTGAWLVTAITRGWLLAGLVCLAPVIVANKTSASSIAVTLGGVLLAQTGFKRLTASFLDVNGAWVSWKRIAFLFRAASTRPALGSGPATESPRRVRPRRGRGKIVLPLPQRRARRSAGIDHGDSPRRADTSRGTFRRRENDFCITAVGLAPAECRLAAGKRIRPPNPGQHALAKGDCSRAAVPRKSHPDGNARIQFTDGAPLATFAKGFAGSGSVVS